MNYRILLIVFINLIIIGYQVFEKKISWDFGLMFFLILTAISILIFSFIQILKENSALLKPIKRRYELDMAKRRAIIVNYNSIAIAILMAIGQFYLCATSTEDVDVISYSYFGILFCSNFLRMIPESFRNQNTSYGGIFLIILFSIIIFGLYYINQRHEILYIIIASYSGLIYHIFHANDMQIKRNSQYGGCMVLAFFIVIIISVIEMKQASFYVMSRYNLYYFFNGLYFLVSAGIDYNSQKMID